MPTHAVKLDPLWSAAQARAADAYTIEDVGVPGIILMEHAGRAVVGVCRGKWPHVSRALVFAGPGNNGGDGWVIARHFWGGGIPCPVVTTASPDTLTGDASLAAQMFLTAAEARGWTCDAFGGPFFLVDLADDVDKLVEVTKPDLVIDAVFGTGLTREVTGVPARVVDGLSRVRAPVIAVDLPSGLPTDGQAPPGPCVSATMTVTFAGRKIAHASEPGRARCGEVRVVDVGIYFPDGTSPAALRVVDARALVPALDPGAFKDKFGHAAALAGEKPGAARLAARASLRTGAGLASVIGAPAGSIAEAEIMTRPLDDKALDHIAALVVGPGLGAVGAEGARALMARAATQKIPCVIDAEALELLLGARASGGNALTAVATPHPGEAARLLGTTSADVQRDRIAALRALKAKLGDGVVVILKGSCPLILGDDGRVLVVEGDAPSLAVAGSGDVLAGAVGGLLARGLSPLDAALVATEAHQRVGRALTGRGHLASEIADALPAALSAT